MEKSTGKIWRAASGKSPFQRRNQQAREELFERPFRSLVSKSHSGTSNIKPGPNVDWYKLLCFGSPTVQPAHQHVWFCTTSPDRAKSLLLMLIGQILETRILLYTISYIRCVLMAYIFRNVFSIKHLTVQGCVFSGMVLFASITAMDAADDGISNLMVPSALSLRRLMELSTWYMEMAPWKIYTAYGKSKVCVRKYQKVRCAWNCGSVTALVTDPLTRTQAGTRFPGFTWKKYHPHRPNSICRETWAFESYYSFKLQPELIKLSLTLKTELLLK